MAKRYNWPEPPKHPSGSPKSWVVVTQEFNKAAEIGIYNKFSNGTVIEIKRNENDDRAGHLVAFYDESYDSFHLDRAYEDGQREHVYSPVGKAMPVDFKDILSLMAVWQQAAECNAVNRNETAHDVTCYTHCDDLKQIIYKSKAAP